MGGVAQLGIIAAVAAAFTVEVEMQDAFDLGGMAVRLGGMMGGMRRCGTRLIILGREGGRVGGGAVMLGAAVLAGIVALVGAALTVVAVMGAVAGTLAAAVLPIRFSERSLVQNRPLEWVIFTDGIYASSIAGRSVTGEIRSTAGTAASCADPLDSHE
jgi:hypothetical protein